MVAKAASRAPAAFRSRFLEEMSDNSGVKTEF
jgi:hypothetical protein